MPKITKAEVAPNPIALGQRGNVVLESVATKGGALTGSVELSGGNDIFFVPNAKTLEADANDSTPFRLERRPGPGLDSPQAVVFFISVKESGVAAQSKRDRLIDIAG